MQLLKSLVWKIRYGVFLFLGFLTIYFKKSSAPHTPDSLGTAVSLANKIATIKTQIADPAVKVVSFDVFDTLVYRPVFCPTDLFYLVANKVNPLYHIDFAALRLPAEKRSQKKHATLEDIYRYIATHCTLNETQINKLKDEELACEKQLLAPRKDIEELYAFALAQHKRIIAVSDMYVPSDFLREVLLKSGYKNIAKIYVSNEYQTNKEEALFDKVLMEEKIEPFEMVHVGDNKRADYQVPLQKNIKAAYYPSIKDIIFSRPHYKTMYRLFPNLSPDPNARMLLAFSLFRIFNDRTQLPPETLLVQNTIQLVNILLGPIVSWIALYIATSPDIQNQYQKIYFAARDGYLPQIAYDVLGKYLHILPSVYLYASRRAYFSLCYDSFEALLLRYSGPYTQQNTDFHTVLENLITDPLIFKQVENKLPFEILKASFGKQRDLCLHALQTANTILATYLTQQRKNTRTYYTHKLGQDAGRRVVFDVGYGGSIGRALHTITNQGVDKIYVWQDNHNRKLDKEYNSRTFCITKNNYTFRWGLQIMLEELFSPLQGSCIGFDTQANPILETLTTEKNTISLFDSIKTNTEDFMHAACQRFGSYLPCLRVNDTNALFVLSLYWLGFCSSEEKNLLKSVCFLDILYTGNAINLQEKLEKIRQKPFLKKLQELLRSR